MKKRILSLVLALSMCLSLFTFGAAVEAATIGELLELYKDRVWDWQTNQFDAMTDEQKAVMDEAWTNYEANEAEIRGLAEEFADLVITDAYLENGLADTEDDKDGTLKNLFKWKLMRDIMEGKIDVTSEYADYADWLNRFTDFETANDEAIKASAPVAALNGLGEYSDTLTEYFGELAEFYENGLVFEGADADKAKLYVEMFLADYAVDETKLADFMTELKADIKELMVDGIVNNFEIGLQVATGQITKENTTGLLDMIADRDMKGAFLLVGEDLAKYLVNDFVTGVRSQLLALNKKDIMAAVIGDATSILSGNNEDAADALYLTMKNLANYMIDDKMDKVEEAEDLAKNKLGIEITEVLIEETVDKVQAAMALVHPDHGLELVHVNTFLGRELLRYDDAGEYVYLNGAEIDGDTVTELALGFGHSRYPVFSSMNEYGIASFDATYDADGIKVYAGDDIGQIMIEVTEEADGEATVVVYRGYTDEDVDGVVDNEENVLRYVTTFKVTATSDAAADADITVDKTPTVDDPTVEVSGTTSLDEVKITVKDEEGNEVEVTIKDKDGNELDPDAVSKEDLEDGIVIVLPDGVEDGDEFTVEVKDPADESVLDSENVTVEAPYVELDDVLDTTVDGTIEVKGTTNLDYVTVAIVKNGETIYAVVYEKAEFEAGITLNAPDNAQEGEVYTVVVGTEKASDSDEFAIVAEGETTVTVDKEPTTADPTVEVSGTTSLDEVKITVKDEEGNEVEVTIKDKDGNELDPDAVSKEDFEEGIVIVLPDGVVAGDEFTVEVKDPADDAVLDDADVTVSEALFITLEDIADFKLSDNENAEITVKGTTNLANVVVSITLNGDEVYTVVHTKAEYEAGITVQIDNATVGNEYTVAVGQEGTEAEDTFKILPEEPVAPSGSLAISGSKTRKVKVGNTTSITATPQNIKPDGATVEIVWTTEDGGIIEVTEVVIDDRNDASIATITKLAKGTEKVTATLYVNGVAVDSEVITIKNPSSGGGSGTSYTDITVKVDETKDVVKAPTGGVNVEFNGTGDGEVKVEIVDGVVVVTGVKEGEVKGEIKVTNEKGNTILTGDYKFTVTEGDEVVVPEHECEWPDIAAGWEGKASAHWAHLTIDAMTINGYIKGYPDGLFKPDQNITRAEFTAIVYRILGLEIAEDGVLYDDTVGHWAQDIIATMSLPEGYGMTRGYGDGNFGPNDYITREQAVAIIARAKSAVWVEAEEGAKDIFTDAEDISWWFDGEMDAAVTNGLITGYQDGSYKPLGFTTRAEACTLLARAWPEVLELD